MLLQNNDLKITEKKERISKLWKSSALHNIF